ncbi:MAG: chemotaxis protein CheD [Desulfovibrio sp.]|mgnify:CR=1 FL=1|nr:MAG: chemotaxis protein CheD [Desulfovibrio sp.]
MNTIVLGVGEYGISRTPGTEIKTFALGSCIAVLLYDLKTKIGGMAHIALPHSSINPDRAQILPGYFSDTGVPALINSICSASGKANGKGLLVKLAGGANMMTTHTAFNIGERNLTAIRNDLDGKGLVAMAEDVGGAISRTVTLDVDTGKVMIHSPGRGAWEL